MRRFVVLTICLLALVPVFSAAQAAGNKGSVQKSWVSRSSGGAREKSFSVKGVKKLYANFIWKVPASPGQELAIEWHDPSGALSAPLAQQDDQVRQGRHAAVLLGRSRRPQGQDRDAGARC